MKAINHTQYLALTKNARMLESSNLGARVWLTPESRIIKLFYRKRRLSSSLIRPHARRFVRNGKVLFRRGIQSVRGEAIYRCSSPAADIVVYPILDGTTLRQMPVGSPEFSAAVSGLPAFLARLHRRGIDFRGIHLGNVLYRPERGFALIDIGFMRFLPWRLHLRWRAKNFRNIMRYNEDCEHLESWGMVKFLRDYTRSADLGRVRTRKFLRLAGAAGTSPILIEACNQLLNQLDQPL